MKEKVKEKELKIVRFSFGESKNKNKKGYLLHQLVYFFVMLVRIIFKTCTNFNIAYNKTLKIRSKKQNSQRKIQVRYLKERGVQIRNAKTLFKHLR